MNDAGIIVITSFISPYIKDRISAREIVTANAGQDNFIEVFVDTPLEICEQRDPKGLYKKVRAGEIPQFTGITDPYEHPVSPEIILKTASASITACAQEIMNKLVT